MVMLFCFQKYYHQSDKAASGKLKPDECSTTYVEGEDEEEDQTFVHRGSLKPNIEIKT